MARGPDARSVVLAPAPLERGPDARVCGPRRPPRWSAVLTPAFAVLLPPAPVARGPDARPRRPTARPGGPQSYRPRQEPLALQSKHLAWMLILNIIGPF